MDVRADSTFRGDAGGFLVRRRNTLLAEPDQGFLDVAAALAERFLAVHHTGAGLVANNLDLRGGDTRGGRGGLSRFFLLLFLLGVLLHSLGGRGGSLRIIKKREQESGQI